LRLKASSSTIKISAWELFAVDISILDSDGRWTVIVSTPIFAKASLSVTKRDLMIGNDSDCGYDCDSLFHL
jgi:hypothetical protein